MRAEVGHHQVLSLCLSLMRRELANLNASCHKLAPTPYEVPNANMSKPQGGQVLIGFIQHV